MLFLCAGAASATAEPSVRTDHAEYETRDPLILNFTNPTTASVFLGSSAPWRVTDPHDITTFYVPPAVTSSDEVLPGQSREWLYEFRDDNGEPLLPGRYRIEFEYYATISSPATLAATGFTLCAPSQRPVLHAAEALLGKSACAADAVWGQR